MSRKVHYHCYMSMLCAPCCMHAYGAYALRMAHSQADLNNMKFTRQERFLKKIFLEKSKLSLAKCKQTSSNLFSCQVEGRGGQRLSCMQCGLLQEVARLVESAPATTALSLQLCSTPLSTPSDCTMREHLPIVVAVVVVVIVMMVIVMVVAVVTQCAGSARPLA